MKKFLFLLMAGVAAMIHPLTSYAQTYDTFLTAGSSTIQAGIDAKKNLDQGYMRAGLNGIYADRDEGKYKFLDMHVAVGDNVLIEGLNGELGIKGIIGSVDRGFGSNNLGSIAFMVNGSYKIPKAYIPLSTGLFAELSWTPGPLAFMDMDRYFDLKAGIDFFIVENAALEIAYQRYDIKIENDQRGGSMKDNLVTIGIKLKF